MNTQRVIFKWLAVVIVITMLSQFGLVLPLASGDYTVRARRDIHQKIEPYFG